MKKLIAIFLVLFLFSSNAFASISNWGGAYKLDDSDQTSTVDSSGNGNTLAEGGSMDEITPGQFGDASHTNAVTDDWHQSADDSDFDVNTSLDFSGGGWTRWISSIGNASGIMSKGTAYVFVKHTDGKVFLRMNSTNATTTTTAISVNTWTYTGYSYTDAAATEVEYWVGTGSTRDGNQNLDVTPTDSATAFTICDDAVYEGCNGGVSGADVDEIWMARQAVTGADHSSIATNGLAAFLTPPDSLIGVIILGFGFSGGFWGKDFLRYTKLVNKHRWKFGSYFTNMKTPRPIWMQLLAICLGWYREYPEHGEQVGWGPGAGFNKANLLDKIEYALRGWYWQSKRKHEASEALREYQLEEYYSKPRPQMYSDVSFVSK